MMKATCILLISEIAICCVSPLLADVLHTKNGDVENTAVTSIRSDKVEYKLDGKRQSLPLVNVSSIEFDAYSVVAKKSGIVLTDGTKLSGVIRGASETVAFRSTSLGRLEIPAEIVAVLYYDNSPDTEALMKKRSSPCVVERTGKVHKGKVLWADALSAGIMTSKGLRKLGAENLAFIRFSTNAAERVCQLRNGDVLNAIASYDGSSISVLVGKRKYRVSVKAVSRLNCKLVR